MALNLYKAALCSAALAVAGCMPMQSAQVAGTGARLDLIDQGGKGQRITLHEVYRNVDARFFSHGTRFSVAILDGVLLSTRGLSVDLFSADIPKLAQLKKGSGSYQRSWQYPGPDDVLQSLTLPCVLKRTTAHQVKETCREGETEITNEYNFTHSGGIHDSVQWVSPQIGYLQLVLPDA